MSAPEMTTDVVGICRWCQRYLILNMSGRLVDLNHYSCDRHPTRGRSDHESMKVDLTDVENVEAFLVNPVQPPYEPPF